jgi:hypothetical protein
MQRDGDWVPYLVKLFRQERYEAHQDPDVRAFLNAEQSEKVERAMAAKPKPKPKDVTGQPARIQHGMRILLTGKGPDAR